ncbi:MAG TPA: aldehyde dehydrogenase family protein [Gemmatimonadales bacterium]|nr:aldehyde dehydrogenase family protein [Gemmatimonadales bacterium]
MDRDLASVQEARDLLARAHAAQRTFARATQAQVDRLCSAVAEAALSHAERLARAAVEETGMGRYEDKVLKNRFAAEDVLRYILPLRTVGVIRELPEQRVTELAVPMGVVAALIPTTNPTSTAIYKALISLKARNAIVMSPHPRAVRCICETVAVMRDAVKQAGWSEDLVCSMTVPALEGTNELMRHKLTAVILATGGYPMVKAAYSSGKPAYGVGPGNVPAIVERTADVPKAVRDIVNGKSFDNGVLCSAENSLIADAPVDSQVREQLAANRAVFVTGSDRDRLRAAMRDPRSGGVSPEVVGLSAEAIARRAGITVPPATRVLLVECAEVGAQEFFSREKLSPVLAYYVEDGWEKCCERAIQLLEFGGIGHSLVIHSRDEAVIQRFFEEKPAFRILVNTMAAMGAVGYTTGLVPAMTLGPGTWAGSSTSDNIGPLHLINVKRLAREIREYRESGLEARGSGQGRDTGGKRETPVRSERSAAPSPEARPLSPEEVRALVDEFLESLRSVRGRR